MPAAAQEAASPNAPVIAKVEPPNWWVNYTPDLMLLVYGKHLEATKANCNLPDITVERTQATDGGNYLFMWLKFGRTLRSGTAVCRIETPEGRTSFELPMAQRQPTAQRFHALTLNDVMYLIMPDRFANGDPTNDEPEGAKGTHDRTKARAYHGGDLKGVEDHLDYLKDLGVTTIWLTPIVKNGSADEYHGYGAVDLYAVDPHLGTMKDYASLVAAAHQKQMKIFFDVVPNHVGPHNPWVEHPPMPDWFHGTPAKHLDSFAPVKGSFYGNPARAQNNDPFEALVDPHAPESLRINTTQGWFFGILPDMNTENPVVTKYLIQNAEWWAESSGLDGFRIDTFAYVSRQFWANWHSALRKIYPYMTTIGEVFHPDPTVTSFFVGGRKQWDGIDTGLSTVFDFPMCFTIRDVLAKDEATGKIANILRQDELYVHPQSLVTFFSNHDMPRFVSEPGSSPAQLKLAYGLLLTLRGIPEIYYGDEIAMPGGGDPDNRRDFPGGWSGDARNAFTEEGRTPEQQDVFATARTLLHLRHDHPALAVGTLWSLYSDDSTYIFLRQLESERMLVVFHKGKQARELSVPMANTAAQGAVQGTAIFGNAKLSVNSGTLQITAPAESLTIFSLD